MVIGAIVHSLSPLLTGTFTAPVETTIEQYLTQHTPELGEERENIETALSFLNLAAGAFPATTEKMRDLAAEDRAVQGTAAAKEADAALQGSNARRTTGGCSGRLKYMCGGLPSGRPLV